MAYATLAVVAPHVTAYDEDYPTRSTENYSHALHEIIQDLEDAGPWYFCDGATTSTHSEGMRDRIFTMLTNVFNYADDAITGWRASEEPGLSAPQYNQIPGPIYPQYGQLAAIQWKVWAECQKMKYLIYYMWETEEDPLLLKEKLREILTAWPLTDVEINLADDAGQQLKLTPTWKNVDI